MALAAYSVQQAQTMIDRGLAAQQTPGDLTNLHASGFLYRTKDKLRSCRWPEFVAATSAFNSSTNGTNNSPVQLVYIDARTNGTSSWLSNATAGYTPHTTMFYFESLENVPGVSGVTFAKGAVADTLTSFSGEIGLRANLSCTSRQISALCFLASGAAAAYGTVREPCAVANKFADPSELIPRYVRGGTILEAYWKSGDTMYAVCRV
jgi:uncharacterized protein (TIGR03790 family)